MPAFAFNAVRACAIVLTCSGAAIVAASAQTDTAQAARGMGYANGVYRTGLCQDQMQPALDLQDDIMRYYGFTSDDLEGKTAVGKSVAIGRANALKDSRNRQEFCDNMEEVLAVWRSQVLPSPK